ncbi:MAG: GTP-binding protein [archaeon]|nr:GTP-binding protein [archaeon]
MEEEEHEKSFKLILVGDTGVGKTNLLSRYIMDEFSIETPSTVTMEFGRKIIEIEGQKIKLQIWDTAGQEKFRSLTQSYFKGSKGALIVYDISKEESFEKVQGWYDDIKASGDKDCVIEIVGNKIDLEESRKISQDVGKTKALKLGTLFTETSALQGTGVEEAFESLVKEILTTANANPSAKGTEAEGEGTANINLEKEIKGEEGENKKEGKKKKGCCK